MPLYDYQCERCGKDWTEYRQMKDASDFSVSPGVCAPAGSKELPSHTGKRVYNSRNIYRFTEDRLRNWRNPQQGGRFSNALGQDMPETRAERDRLCEEKGIEFVSPRDMPEQWKEAIAYKEHVDSGGDHYEATKPENFPAFTGEEWHVSK